MAELEPQSSSEEDRRRQLEEWKSRVNWNSLDPIQRSVELAKLAMAKASFGAGGNSPESNPERKDPLIEAVKALRKQETESSGFGILSNGNIAGAISLGLGGLLLKNVGDSMFTYGRANFPLDPFTKLGRAAMKKQYNEIKGNLKGAASSIGS